ncbi:PIN domain-containing protein [Microbacterium sp.]|uniref:PIN domain-containing protein n=1 Tax=Microbacterium sp. TaxID=51671 RepID=UPI0039E30E0D
MIVDTSALLAYFDAAEPRHAEVAGAIEVTDEPLVVSPYVIAELDYLLLSRHGSRAERLALEELGSGAWELAQIDARRLAAAARIVSDYADVPIGVADAANIVLADAYGTETIATLDRRHFSVLRLGNGRPAHIVP